VVTKKRYDERNDGCGERNELRSPGNARLAMSRVCNAPDEGSYTRARNASQREQADSLLAQAEISCEVKGGSRPK
jgi:hypothetical protein